MSEFIEDLSKAFQEIIKTIVDSLRENYKYLFEDTSCEKKKGGD